MHPPTKLKVKVQGKVKKHQQSKSEVYILQSKLVNGYPTWKQKTSKNSIWFSSILGEWAIGWTSDVGSATRGIKGSSCEDDWPQNLFGWKYFDGTGTWRDAGSDVVIEDYSSGKLETQSPESIQFSKYLDIHPFCSYPCWSFLQNVWNWVNQRQFVYMFGMSSFHDL